MTKVDDNPMSKAHAARDATIQSAQARQEGETAKYGAETKIAESQKDYRVQKAHYDEEANREEVKAELARTLQERITNQDITALSINITHVCKTLLIAFQGLYTGNLYSLENS